MSILGSPARASRHVVLPAAAALATPFLVAVVAAGPASAAPRDVVCQGKPSDKIATRAGQRIKGTAQRDVISANGFAGVRIDGLGGDDILCGSPSGAAGDGSSVRGGPGNDAIEAGPGVRVHGGAGDDFIAGGSAVLHGDAGNDHLRTTGAGTSAYGDAGNDTLDSTGGDDQHYFGGEGDDNLAAPGGSGHVLSPGLGNDVVTGPPTATLDYGGPEPVTFDVAAGTAVGQGTDTFSGIRRFDGGYGADVFLGTDAAEYYTSTQLPPTGMPGVDAVWGQGGNDHLIVAFGDVHAGSGGDYVRILGGAAAGNEGNDTMIASYQGSLDGGSGDDDLSGEVDLAANEVPVGRFAFLGGDGRDEIRLPYPTSAAASITACGAQPICRSTADGGSGADVLDLRAVHGHPRVKLSGAGSVTYRLGRSTAGDFERVQGSPGDDRIRGNAEANRIDGNGGRDRIWGRDGDDVLLGGDGKDRLIGGDGRDRANGGPGRDSCRAEIRRSC